MPIMFSIFYPSNNLLLLLYIYYYPPHISMVHSGEKKKNLNGNPMLNIKQINSEDKKQCSYYTNNIICQCC